MSVTRSAISWLAAIGAALTLSGCGYNQFQTLDETVKGSWAEVLNQYQRRADLIPNIVATVKGEANFEQETLTKVIEARDRLRAFMDAHVYPREAEHDAFVNDPAHLWQQPPMIEELKAKRRRVGLWGACAS